MSENNPNNRSHADQRALVNRHERNPGPNRPCFWKHNYGQSSDTCIRISQSETDTHACHYQKNSVDKAEAHPEVYNTRNGKRNRQKAEDLGYIRGGQVNNETEEYTSGAAREGAKKFKQGKSKMLNFLNAYRGRYGKSLHWLVLDPQGWDVGYRAGVGSEKFKNVYGGHKTNRKRSFANYFNELVARFGRKPKNFAIRKSVAEPGLGQWYPYEHDHHHLLPVSAFQQYVLNKQTNNGIDYMKRAAVVMKSTWNIHHQENMMMLPREVFVARILDLPAHIPWQSGADHKGYSLTFEKRLDQVRARIDRALAIENKRERHEAVTKAANDIKSMLETMSRKARQNLLDDGFFVIRDES